MSSWAEVDPRSRALGPILGGLLAAAAAGCGGGVVTDGDSPDGPAGGGDGAGPRVDAAVSSGDGGCPSGLLDCGDGCVDPLVDHAHCGGCGRECAPDQECQAGDCGACADECTAGDAECAGTSRRECGDFDGDTCLDWSAFAACPGGAACDPATATCGPACGDFCDPFSVVLLPDTQYYTQDQPDGPANTYRKQTTWIRDNRAAERIQMAIHLGDITNNNVDSEWLVADHAHDVLDAAGVPYSMVPGNHDYRHTSGWDRSRSQFDARFGAARFAGRPWYGGPLGSSAVNNYTTFEVGPMKFMVISLEYAPRKDAICRAGDLIAANPDRRVIIATHCYLTTNGNYAGCPSDEYLTLGADGATLWNELIGRHSNIFLVVSGHVGESKRKPRPGNTGNEVQQLVVDYQWESACTAATVAGCTNSCDVDPHTGNGWLRQLVFDPLLNEVRGHTLSVEDGNSAFFPGGEPALFCSELNTHGENRYPSDPLAEDHDFAFTYDLGAMPPYAYDDLGLHAFLDRTVNSASAGDQLVPRAAMSAAGPFVVVWQDDSSSTDGTSDDIHARGFRAGGCGAFADVTVNVTTDGQQGAPDVAADAAGNFVVVWEDDADLNGTYQIHARGFHADGTERFARLTVNTESAGQQRDPAVAMAPDGRFVVVWEDDQDGDGLQQIWMRGFNADGTQAFADRSAHADAAGRRVAPAIGLDGAARFVVTWQDDSDGNGTYQIHARGFHANGTERFAVRAVNSVATGDQLNPAIGVDANGLFVVAWEDDQNNDDRFEILARGFNADGSPRIADFSVPGTTAGNRVTPAVGMQGDGTFAVTWADDTDANGTFQIHARAFRADGAAWGDKFTVNRQDSGQQEAPHVAVAGGSMVVAWEDDMDGNGSTQILARGIDLR